jgi:ankyrin repeat protein
MKFLLENKANAKAVNAGGANALLIAAGTGWRDGKTRAPDEMSVGAVKYLINTLGMDVNGATPAGETPLHAAANRGSDLVVETLVAMGGKLNVKDKQNRSPYDMANGAGGSAFAPKPPQESTLAVIRKLGGKPGKELPDEIAATKLP